LTSILFKGGTVVTMDPKRRVLFDTDLIVEDGIITSVESSCSFKSIKAERVIPAHGKLILPGLIDTHIHLAQALIRGCADDLSLVDWLQKRVWPLQGNYTESDGLLSSELCVLEMLKSGTTTFLESGLHKRYGNQAIASMVERSGIRGFLSKMIMDSGGYGGKSGIMHPGMIEKADECLREAEELFKSWNGRGGGRVGVWLAARSLGGVSPPLYKEVAKLASELGTGITMHLNEVPEDSRFSMENYGMRPVEFAKSVGLLGRYTVFAHMVWATDEEISILASTKSNVAHCPSSNSKLASGVARIPELISNGVNVGLGCDGAPCNNTYDMFREMRMVPLLQKFRMRNPHPMDTYTILEMATINGARALGIDDKVGSIEVGKRADLVMVNLQKGLHYTPFFDPVSSVVYSASGADVDTVLVDGKVLVENGRVLTLDEDRILKEARERLPQILKRTGIS